MADAQKYAEHTFSDMLKLSFESFKEEWNQINITTNFPQDVYNTCIQNHKIGQYEISAIMVIAVLFTIHRYVYTRFILKVSLQVSNFLRFYFPSIAISNAIGFPCGCSLKK